MKAARRAPAWARTCLSCLCLAALPSLLAAPVQHQVVIDAMRFTPQVVQVRPGDTITWVNRDLVAHNVTANGAKLRSGDLAPGQSWRYTVRPGASFGYVCTLHPVMNGRVELETARHPSRSAGK